MSRQRTDDDDDDNDRTAATRTGRAAIAGLTWMLAASASLGPAAGCGSPPRPDLLSEDPAAKVPAIKIAVRERDRDAARVLVRDLRDADPAVRFYAIQGLRRLAGENFGFRYYDDERAREPAVRRWERWLAEQDGTARVVRAARADRDGGDDPVGNVDGANVDGGSVARGNNEDGNDDDGNAADDERTNP